MLVVVSPAKKLDFENNSQFSTFSQCDFLKQSQELVDIAKNKTANDLKNMMGISDKLAELNVQRFKDWNTPFDLSNAKQAVFAFNGDTYTGLDAGSLSENDLEYAQNHFRILSGLYGVLRPLDLMQAYRLEMGTKFANPKGEDLYDFWGDKIAKALDNENQSAIVNCASNEYFSAIDKKSLKTPIIDTVFKEVKDGKAKIVSFSAKRARGMMARYIIQNKIEKPSDLKNFDTSGYKYMADESNENTYVFHRESK
ncbi:MAG: peroxide stress protein YaaA [Alphaproteobacteria bacterium]